jgi:hypothetical protein
MSTNLFRINCVLHDDEDPRQHLFTVEIDPTSIVGQLKYLIKAKTLPKADFTADELILWRVSIPAADEHLATRLKEIRLDGSDSDVTMLFPCQLLSDAFSGEDRLAVGNVHVLVQQPGNGECLRLSFTKGISPSDSTKAPLERGRG